MKKKNNTFVYALVGVLLLGSIIGVSLLIGDKEKKNGKGVTYYYEATLNENMINYDLTILEGSDLNGELYSSNGEWLSELKNGKAIINESDYQNNTSFKIKVNDKIYEITKK